MTKKKNQIQNLVTFVIVMGIIVIITFIPTIYRSSTSGANLSVLFDEYGYSYQVSNRDSFVYCDNCGYGEFVLTDDKNLDCPTCQQNGRTVRLNISAVIDFNFTKRVLLEDENGYTYEKVVEGQVYQFAKDYTERGYSYLKNVYEDEVVVNQGLYVFVLTEKPSVELSEIINKCI